MTGWPGGFRMCGEAASGLLVYPYPPMPKKSRFLRKR
jgi:hypothetical protein